MVCFLQLLSFIGTCKHRNRLEFLNVPYSITCSAGDDFVGVPTAGCFGVGVLSVAPNGRRLEIHPPPAPPLAVAPDPTCRMRKTMSSLRYRKTVLFIESQQRSLLGYQLSARMFQSVGMGNSSKTKL